MAERAMQIREENSTNWKQFWAVASMISTLCFPVITATGGYFVGHVLNHETAIAVIEASYLTKEESATKDGEIKASIDSLRQSINDLKLEVTKALRQP